MGATDEPGELLLAEHLTPSDRVLHTVERLVLEKRTDYQLLHIVESSSFGKALLLDNTWQSCTLDEFIYHESLVHPAMLMHGAPRSVLILGGGEGATAREVLRWRGVERVTMVDIDGEVVQACRQHLPEMHRGAFDDPRLELVIGDALALLDTTDQRWDVVISDLSDPIEHGPSFQLFTREYFTKARRAVADGGVFVVQAGSVSPVDIEVHARLHRTVATTFAHAATLTAFVPSFGTPWSFILGRDAPLDTRPDPVKIEAVLRDNVDGEFGMLSGEGLLAQLTVPPYVRQAIASAKVPYTLADPPKFGNGIGA